MLTEISNGSIAFDNGMFSFNSGIGVTNKSSSIDALEKLGLIKSYTDIVISSALKYSNQTGTPLTQMIKVGFVALIKLIRANYSNTNINYESYLKIGIENAMMDFIQKSI
jgi:DNA-directed RNA polymerase specialized sigma subunit